MTADDPTRFGGQESSDDTTTTPRGSLGPLLDAFRATEAPALAARDVADHARNLTAADAAAALRQLEVDGVAMSKELDSGLRLWWLQPHHGGSGLAEARATQEKHHETRQAAAAIRREAQDD